MFVQACERFLRQQSSPISPTRHQVENAAKLNLPAQLSIDLRELYRHRER
jgi:hypothetical protein